MYKNIVLILLLPISILFSCSYSTPVLRREISPSGEKTLHIVYPTPKVFGYDTAATDNNVAVLFTITDYTTISFPPPGAIIDNRKFYYLGLTDRDANPLWRRPLLLEEHKKTAQIYSGRDFALFPCGSGFLSVFYRGDSFFYMVTGAKGESLTGKTIFYKNERDRKPGNMILSISFHRNTIYLLLLEGPENIYRERWSINLVKRDISSEKTEIYKDFIPGKNGWYYSGKMEVYHTDEFFYIAWVDGEYIKKKPEDTSGYLYPKFYFAACPAGERVCSNYRTILKSDSYTSSRTAFTMQDGNLYLAIREKRNTLLGKINRDGSLENRLVKVSENDKGTVPDIFNRKTNSPYKVRCGE